METGKRAMRSMVGQPASYEVTCALIHVSLQVGVRCTSRHIVDSVIDESPQSLPTGVSNCVAHKDP